MHLLDERLHGLETPLAAQALYEGDPERLAVEIAVEVDQVRLDQQAAASLELRPDAHVHRGATSVGPRRVDAMARVHEALVGYQVRRGKSQLAPALVAVCHLALDDERAAEHARGLLDVPRGHERADLRRGDRLAVDLDQWRHTRREF